MAERKTLVSEEGELDAALKEIAGTDSVREFAGWESGFPDLSQLLNGILPGLYLLVGPPACGKTTFARQLCDQVAMHNSVPALFVTFSERRMDLRLKTLARLSRLEARELRRGRSFLLHRYGVPKGQSSDPGRLPPSWQKVEVVAGEARVWLSRIYLLECNEQTNIDAIREDLAQVGTLTGSGKMFVVIDDSQRLGLRDVPFDNRLPLVVEQLHLMARDLDLCVLGIWPDLKAEASANLSAARAWAEVAPYADVIMVMADDPERTKKLTEPNRAINLHIVKNREGERATLQFDFSPAFSCFIEVAADPTP